MLDYEKLIKTLALEVGKDFNSIVSNIIDLEHALRSGGDDGIILATVDEGDSSVIYHIVPMPFFGRDSFKVSIIYDPYDEEEEDKWWSTYQFYEFAISVLFDGGFVEKATEYEVAYHKRRHTAEWLIDKYNFAILSDGDDTITCYENDEGWMIDGRQLSTLEAKEAIFIELHCDCFKVIFKGFGNEVK